MDWCAKCAKSHDHRGVFLIPYNGIIGDLIIKHGRISGKVEKKPAPPKPVENDTLTIKYNGKVLIIPKHAIKHKISFFGL